MKTQSFNTASSNFGATLKQGTKMIFGGDVANYTLVFLDATTTDKAQTSKMIVVPNITIGRSSACHVRYGDEFSTVSRQHASITGANNQFFLNHNPQASNPTLVNGQPVHGPHLLKNEDVVQFSQNGPRLRFLASATKTSTMGMTARVNRVLGQAIRPYKRAIGLLGFLLLGSLLFGAYNFYNSQNLEEELISQKEKATENTIMLGNAQNSVDSLERVMRDQKSMNATQRMKVNNEINKYKSEVATLKKEGQDLHRIIKQYTSGENVPTSNNSSVQTSNSGSTNLVGSAGQVNFESLPTDDVYYIYATKYEYAYQGKMKSETITERGGLFSGTAFLTEDNLLVTARHNVQPYRFFKDQKSLTYNLLEANGARIIVTFVALNKKGDRFSFNTKNAIYNDSSDKETTFTYDDETYEPWQGKVSADNSSDWAYIKIGSRKGTIKYDRELSKRLKTGANLHPVGFTHGEALQPTVGDIKPLVTTTMVAQDGLTNGVINTSLVGFGPGNSGGPVFYRNSKGEFIVVGIVSAGIGSSVGVITPIGNMW